MYYALRKRSTNNNGGLVLLSGVYKKLHTFMKVIGDPFCILIDFFFNMCFAIKERVPLLAIELVS
jgi:hypothetical protein